MADESVSMRGHVGLYLVLTFVLSWGFDLVITLTIGHPAFLRLGLAPWSMFAPAAVALALQVFAFRDSPIHIGRYRDRSILIPISFLGLTVLYGTVTLLAIGLPAQRGVLSGAGNLLTTLWTLCLFALYGQVGEEGLACVGLPLGNLGRGFRIALTMVIFLLTQLALNVVFALGVFPGVLAQVYGVSIPPTLYPVALVPAFLLTITGTPLTGLAPTFGEEYGWRGVLLHAWLGHGKRQAAFLVGLVWGVWHIPVILGGIHTYPPTLPGLLMALVFFALWGVVQSYVVLKTGSVWVAAFLHGLVNSLYAFGITYMVRPVDKTRAFGLGLYGLLCLAPIVFLLLRDPVWQPQMENDPGVCASEASV